MDESYERAGDIVALHCTIAIIVVATAEVEVDVQCIFMGAHQGLQTHDPQRSCGA
jgi:hypothetical protein